MARRPVALLIALVLATAPVAAQTVEREPPVDGVHVLTHEVVLARSVEEAWRLFTTEAGITSWMVPFAHVDLRPGGVIETSYDPSAEVGDPDNIRAEILSLDPGRMTTALGAVPPQFTEAKAEGGLWGVTTYEALDPRHTRVTIRMLGFGEGDEWDQVYAFFLRGNAYYCDMLAQRFGDDADEQARAAALLQSLVGRSWVHDERGRIAFAAGAAGRVLLTHDVDGDQTLHVLGPDAETGSLAAFGFLPGGERFRAALGEQDGALVLDGRLLVADGSRHPLRIDVAPMDGGALQVKEHDGAGGIDVITYTPEG